MTEFTTDKPFCASDEDGFGTRPPRLRYDHVLSAFCAVPWAILPSKFEEIRAFLRAKVRGEQLPDYQAGPRPGVQMAGKVAIMPIFGVISQRASMMEKASGGVSAEEVGATLDGLVADKQVRAIVLAFDSPGGSVAGVPELAKKIRDAREQKKVVGLADSMAASAAYWLMAQTAEVNVAPSGQVGSIGVIAAHTDVSKAEEMLGMKTTLVTSSPYKGELASEAPLSEEARAELQSKVNAFHGMFVADLAKGRGTTEARVESDFGKGRMMLAKEAVAAGMADRVATLSMVVARLGGDGAAASVGAMLAAYRARAVVVQEGE